MPIHAVYCTWCAKKHRSSPAQCVCNLVEQQAVQSTASATLTPCYSTQSGMHFRIASLLRAAPAVPLLPLAPPQRPLPPGAARWRGPAPAELQSSPPPQPDLPGPCHAPLLTCRCTCRHTRETTATTGVDLVLLPITHACLQNLPPIQVASKANCFAVARETMQEATGFAKRPRLSLILWHQTATAAIHTHKYTNPKADQTEGSHS